MEIEISIMEKDEQIAKGYALSFESAHLELSKLENWYEKQQDKQEAEAERALEEEKAEE